ncbi:MAG TPA: zinc-binding alcohol dehydrogenase [Spirochaetia bacterium]|nr:zinc-binding alcohol dehydrogenase [Spirochaetia bacterium]
MKAKPEEPTRLNSRSLFFTSRRQVEIRREVVNPGRDEIVMYSDLIGISHGTELLLFRGEMPVDLPADELFSVMDGSLAYPVKYGYMNVATAASGKRYFVFYPHQDLFACKIENAVPLPDSISTDDALFLASMETALGVMQDARPVAGDSVLLVGLGVVGILIAELLHRCGVSPIIAVDPIGRRREVATAIGCETVDPGREGVCDRIREMTGGHGPDIAIDTSASADGLQLAIDVANFAGLILEASWFGTNAVLLNLGAGFHRKRLTIRSSQVSRIGPELEPRWTKNRRLARALEYVAEVRPSRLISHRFALSDAALAYALIADHPEDVLQVVLDPKN